MIAAEDNPLGISIARRRTRRLVVMAYAALMAFGVFAILVRGDFRSLGIVGPVFFMLPLMLGGVKQAGMVKPFRTAEAGSVQLFKREKPLDEREMDERDRIHFQAHTITRWLAAVLFFTFTFCVQSLPAALPRIGTTFLFLLALSLWSLPQCMILWTEPDMEEEA